MRIAILVFAISLMPVITACTPPRPCPADAVDFTALFEEKYATPFRNGDIEKWVETFSADALALHNRRPADIGREAISSFGKMVAATFRFARYDVNVVETRKYCDMAVTHGTYASEFIFRETGQPAPWGPEQGKFLIVWQHQANGDWKIVADMGNASD